MFEWYAWLTSLVALIMATNLPPWLLLKWPNRCQCVCFYWPSDEGIFTHHYTLVFSHSKLDTQYFLWVDPSLHQIDPIWHISQYTHKWPQTTIYTHLKRSLKGHMHFYSNLIYSAIRMRFPNNEANWKISRVFVEI